MGHCEFHAFRQRDFLDEHLSKSIIICQLCVLLFVPNLSKVVSFAATPLVLTPFLRNQGSERPPAFEPSPLHAASPGVADGAPVGGAEG